MPRAESRTGACQSCTRTDVSVIDSGMLRSHAADGHRVTASNPACPGSGKDPRSSDAPRPDTLGFVCRVPAGPEGCGHPVQLTANGRARSHLDNRGERCDGGSDYPIHVDGSGNRTDTKTLDPETFTALVLRPESPAPDAPFEALLERAVGDPGSLMDVYGRSKPVTDVGLPDPHEAEATSSLAADASARSMDELEFERSMRAIGRDETTRLTKEVITALERRTPEQKLETARRMDETASAALGLPRDPALPGPVECACNIQWAGVEAMRAAGHDDMDCTEAPKLVTDRGSLGDVFKTEAHNRIIRPADPWATTGAIVDAPDELDNGPFDAVHLFTDSSGTDWVHPGGASVCRSPECCKHPRGFDWGDDEHGHSGAFCFLCGAEEPSCPPHEKETVAVDRQPVERCSHCYRPWAEAEAENLVAWRAPADLLAKMPEDVRRLAADNPECWECGHEVTPLADRFEPDGSVKHVVWSCKDRGRGNEACHTDWCRPQHSSETYVGRLNVGVFFVRHTAKQPLNRLVYQVSEAGPGHVSAIVVSAGPYRGRTGSLTNPLEEITCVDQDGTPCPRRDPRPGRLAPQPPSPTPSAPAAPAPRPTNRTPGRSSSPSTRATAKEPVAAPSTPVTSSVPSATVSTRTPTARKKTETVAKDAFSTAKQAASESDKYDNYGRYKLTHPATGKPVKWTRATTYAKSIADTYNLSMWSQRMTLKGAALRPDIIAAVATLDVKEDRARVNALVDDAKKAAGDKVAANLGTAVHAFTEDRDKALVGIPVQPQTIPEKLQPTVDAYESLLREFGLLPVPGLIEFTTAVQQYEIAGTSDRCYRVTRDITFKLHGRMVTLYAGEYVIGDVKSGADLSYGWMEIAVQLAIYAQGINTSGVFDWSTATWGHPTVPGEDDVQIKVRTDVGLIPHLPVDRKDGDPLATLFAVDLDWGWATAVLCGQVRTARKEGNLATALTVADLAQVDDLPVPESAGRRPVSSRSVSARPATLEERAEAVTTQAAASALWKEAVAARTPKDEVNRLVAIMKESLESFVEQGG